MLINKTGWEHIECGTNCQDYGFKSDRESIVCDGCSEGKHSEVGAKLFCLLKGEKRWSINDIFRTIYFIIGPSEGKLKDYSCFTILDLLDEEEAWEIEYCGDGFIILQDNDGNITFEELTDGEYPKYYIYNYIDKDHLKHYKNGVEFSNKSYSKLEYKKVGIASDGLRYILNADESLKSEFINCLKSGKEVRTKLFINRNHNIFKDDITIIF